MSEYLTMPKAVRAARLLMWVQAALALLGLLLLFVIMRTAQHVSESAATWGLFFLVAAAQVVFLAFLAANMGRPRPWIRRAGIGVEAVLIPLRLLDILVSGLSALVGLALAVAVIVHLTRDEARDWFAVNAVEDQ